MVSVKSIVTHAKFIVMSVKWMFVPVMLDMVCLLLLMTCQWNVIPEWTDDAGDAFNPSHGMRSAVDVVLPVKPEVSPP